ncbi:hypothetical protein [Neisseria cinerea]|jgi:hypothetical protein|uniref:hypothetical protein n=1 Tax=Neisseria cinerea TaxID=483 RepID=UPI0027DF3D92|nr:hypothetical protein [Neisseria cinerea]
MSQKTWEIYAVLHLISIIILAIFFTYLTLSSIPLGKYHYIVSSLSGIFAASMLNFLKKDVPYFKKNKYLKLLYSFIFKLILGYLLIWVTFKITNDFPQDKYLFIGYCSFWFWFANILTGEIINYLGNETKLNSEESVFLLDFINHYRKDFYDNFHSKSEPISINLKEQEPSKEINEHKILSSIDDKIKSTIIETKL